MKHILVVDDDKACCDAVRDILRALDYDVEIVMDGDVALKRLRANTPDAVLVGLNIPAMADNAFVIASHRDARCKNVPVLVMAVTPRAAVSAIHMGARGCIKKPVEAGEVVSALHPFTCTLPQNSRYSSVKYIAASSMAMIHQTSPTSSP